jgi:glycosyltransferase involved in cell wall biosynthesis
MKIAMIGQKGIPAIYGGIERHVEELSVRLVGLGHQVVVYTRPYFTAKQLETYRGVSLVSLRSIKTKHLDAISHTFFATLHAVRSNVDVIHYHGVGPSLLSFLPKLLGSKAKVVSTFHCVDRKHQKWGLFARLLLRAGEYASAHYPDQTIVVSKTLQHYVAAEFGTSSVYIPNGIEPQPLRATRASGALERFALQPRQYIISVSRLIPHKGIHYLISAFRSMKTEKKLVIVGDGFFTDEYVQYLHELAAGDPRIIFTGFQTGQELRELFTNAAVYVLPSEAEGLPIALLEAASYSVPLVASDIPENIEVLTATPRSLGLSFRTGDVDDLRRVLQQALRRPSAMKTMAKHARNIVNSKYNWDDVSKNTEAVYRRLVGEMRHIPVRGRTSLRQHRIAVTSLS